MARYKNLVGMRFSRLEVICEAGRNNSGGVKWECRCDCGFERFWKVTDIWLLARTGELLEKER